MRRRLTRRRLRLIWLRVASGKRTSCAVKPSRCPCRRRSADPAGFHESRLRGDSFARRVEDSVVFGEGFGPVVALTVTARKRLTPETAPCVRAGSILHVRVVQVLLRRHGSAVVEGIAVGGIASASRLRRTSLEFVLI